MSHGPAVRRLRLTWVDALFGVLAVVTAVTYLRLLRGYEFRGDDWRLFDRGHTVGDYFEPYNGHLSAVPIAIYKLLARTVGLESTVPLRLVSAGALLALGTSIYLLVRARTTPALALLAGGLALWFHNFQTTPSAFNHWLALTGAVWGFVLIQRPGRAALVGLVVTTVFALCSSGVGVAGAVGLLAFAVLSKAGWARIVAVAVPVAAWAVWYASVGGSKSTSDASLGGALGFMRDGVVATFRAIALGNRVGGWILLAAFVALAGVRAARGMRVVAGQVAWSAALAFWWLGLSRAREAQGTTVSRFHLVGAAFALLAVLPLVRPEWFTPWRIERPRVIASALLTAGLVVLVIAVNHTAIFDHAQDIKDEAPGIRQHMVTANLGPDVVPDLVPMQFEARANINAGTYRALTRQYGMPRAAVTSHPDEAVVRLGRIRVHRRPAGAKAACRPLDDALAVLGDSTTVLRGGDEPVTVQVRRFDDGWVPVGTISAGTTARLELPALGSTNPWQVRAPGVCRVRVAPAAVIVRPKRGERVSGKVALAATTTQVVVAGVRFELRRDEQRRDLGEADLGYGWLLEWDSTEVTDGRWQLVAVATEPGGTVDESRPVPLVVDN